MVGAPLRGRAFLHMDIFLFNDVSRFRHNESGFSQIFIYCGCVKSHGRVWKNEGLGVISLVLWDESYMLEKAAVRFFFSLFQPLLRQRSPRHLYMSSWQFLRTYI